jgi:hypothetical protein
MDGEQQLDAAREPRGEPKCPICGAFDWRVPPQTNNVSFPLASGDVIEAQPHICGGCSYVRFHAKSLMW